MRGIPLLLALAALGGCQASDEPAGPGAMTVGEKQALEDAAAMLDARPDPGPSATAPDGP